MFRNQSAYSNKTVDDKNTKYDNSKHCDIVLKDIAKIELPIQFSNSITVHTTNIKCAYSGIAKYLDIENNTL